MKMGLPEALAAVRDWANAQVAAGNGAVGGLLAALGEAVYAQEEAMAQGADALGAAVEFDGSAALSARIADIEQFGGVLLQALGISGVDAAGLSLTARVELLELLFAVILQALNIEGGTT
jgi:hypothetical protein